MDLIRVGLNRRHSTNSTIHLAPPDTLLPICGAMPGGMWEVRLIGATCPTCLDKRDWANDPEDDMHYDGG